MARQLYCGCDEWSPNIEKVNAPLMLLYARNPGTANQYSGTVFHFCPWCGKPLKERELESLADSLPQHGR